MFGCGGCRPPWVKAWSRRRCKPKFWHKQGGRPGLRAGLGGGTALVAWNNGGVGVRGICRVASSLQFRRPWDGQRFGGAFADHRCEGSQTHWSRRRQCRRGIGGPQSCAEGSGSRKWCDVEPSSRLGAGSGAAGEECPIYIYFETPNGVHASRRDESCGVWRAGGRFLGPSRGLLCQVRAGWRGQHGQRRVGSCSGGHLIAGGHRPAELSGRPQSFELRVGGYVVGRVVQWGAWRGRSP